MVKQQWILMSYRVPREPSTPRIAIWRRLKQLGVVQIGDGLVALPNADDAQEQLEWVAEAVTQADGEAVVWRAEPTTSNDHQSLVDRIQHERQAEYIALLSEIVAAGPTDARTTARWRREFRRIDRRDYLGAPGRDEVKQAIADKLPANQAETVAQ